MPSSSICSACARPSSPHLPAAYAAMNGRGRTADVGGDEDDVAAAPLDHRRARTPGPAGARRRRSGRARGRTARESTSVIVARRDRAGVGDHHLDVAEVGGTALANASTESSSVRSSGCTTASPPSARIWAATSSSLSVRRAPSATGKPARPEPERRGGADAGRLAPVTTAGRRSGWAYLSLAISAPSPGSASAANPRTLRECTRSQRSWSTSTVRTRATSSVSAMRASSRARLAPRQKCRPPPKLTGSAPARPGRGGCRSGRGRRRPGRRGWPSRGRAAAWSPPVRPCRAARRRRSR